MKSKQIKESVPLTYALIFDKGDEVTSVLSAFAERANLLGSHFTAVGAFERVVLGYFDRARKDYRKIPIEEQVEVLSLVGDVAVQEGGGPKIHAHVVVGKSDGTAHGGHLLEAVVWPTLEVILTEEPSHLWRRHDAETGLTLIAAENEPKE